MCCTFKDISEISIQKAKQFQLALAAETSLMSIRTIIRVLGGWEWIFFSLGEF